VAAGAPGAFRGRQCCAAEELMRKAFLFVIVVALVATGLHLFVAGLFFTSETNIWYVVSGGWLIGLGGDRLWRDFVALDFLLADLFDF
jgi:hypothetical protein